MLKSENAENICFNVLCCFSGALNKIGCCAATARLQLIKMCLLTFLFANNFSEFSSRYENKEHKTMSP